MKRITFLFITLLAALSLTACNQSAKHSQHHSVKTEHVQRRKHHKNASKHAKRLKKKAKKIKKTPEHKNQKIVQATTNSSAQQQNQQPPQGQAQNTQHQLTQGEINMQRGYDPNGAPLLPGQDHAAGSNPDGTPDAWVQGQINWEKQHGYRNPDDSPTEKGKEADRWAAENDHPVN